MAVTTRVMAITRERRKWHKSERYLRAYESVSDARAIGRYLRFSNERRPYASLDGMTPDQAYFTPLPFRSAA
jgi:putative transposase